VLLLLLLAPGFAFHLLPVILSHQRDQQANHLLLLLLFEHLHDPPHLTLLLLPHLLLFQGPAAAAVPQATAADAAPLLLPLHYVPCASVS
jgi:hypothetical protein